MAGQKIVCVNCAHEVEPPAGIASAPLQCPACGKALSVSGDPVPAAAESSPVSGANAAPAGAAACPFCLAAIGPADVTLACPGCQALYHDECWRDNGGCGVYGCSQAPVVESRSAIETPASYWGQDHKPCPACNQQILAVALRCRHCGTMFASARPQGAAEFQNRVALEESLPQARRQVIWIFVFSVVPFLSPVGAAWGAIWRRSHDREMEALPVIYRALSKIGLITAIGFSVVMIAMTCLYALVRTN